MATIDDLLVELQEIRRAMGGSGSAFGGTSSTRSTRTPRSAGMGSISSSSSLAELDKYFEKQKKYIEEQRKMIEEAHQERMRDLMREDEYREASNTRQRLMDKDLLKEKQEKREQAAKKEKEALEEQLRLEQEIKDLKASGASDEEINQKIAERNDAINEHLRKLKEVNRLKEEELRIQNKLNKSNYLVAIGKDVKNIENKVKQVYQSITQFLKPWEDADHAASKYAKTVGMTAAGMDQLRKNTINNVAKGIAGDFNMSTQELLEAQTKFIKASGRNMMVGNEDQRNIAAMSKFENANEIAAQFENFGLSISESSKHVGKMYATATKTGLSWEKYSGNLAKNVKLAQNYTFKNGLKGLESMAKKATAMKLDMQQVANFADKVSTVGGAIETSAQLQVLGGPFASMADPMGMLNEGLHDMEGLQDRMIKMVQGMGRFNRSTGEVEVSAFNKQRLKAAAQAMGVDYSQIMESVNASARRNEMERQINSSSKASNFDEDLKELIKNQGVIQDGKAGIIDANGKFKSLDKVNEKDRDWLVAKSRTDSENIQDIAKNLRSLKDKREGVEKSYEAQKARLLEMSGIGQTASKIFGVLSTMSGILMGIAAMQMAGQLIGGVGRLFSGGKKVVKGVGWWARRIFKGGGKKAASKGVKSSARTVKRTTKKGAKASSKAVKKTSKATAKKTAKATTKKTAKATAKKVTKKTTKKAVTKSVAKKAAKKTAKKAVAKSVAKKATGKALAGTLGKTLLKSAAKGGPVGAVLGAAGIAGNYFTDKAIADGKMKKGGAGHYAAKMGSQALAFAGMGALLGPIGAAVGAGIGAVVGAAQATKARREDLVDKQLQSKGIERKGNYGARGLKLIDNALQTGELNDRMRKKLIREGDTALLDEINKVKEAKEAKALEKEKTMAEAKKTKFNIKNADITINNGSFSAGKAKSRFRNSVFGTTKIVSPFEKANNAITGIRNIGARIRAKAETGKGSTWERIRSRVSGRNELTPGKQGENKAFDVNINGTLKLVGERGQSVDIIKELVKHPQMLRALADMISKEMARINDSTYIPRKIGQ